MHPLPQFGWALRIGVSKIDHTHFRGAFMNTSATEPEPGKPRRLLMAVIVLAAVATLAVTALLVNILNGSRKHETRFTVLSNWTIRLTILRYGQRTSRCSMTSTCARSIMQRTKYGGSEGLPHSPTQADPRSVVARSKLEQDPRLKTIWAGYSFSADYRERRGHAYMLDDQTFTERQKFAPPAMCINCHASLVTTLPEAGERRHDEGFRRHQRHPHDLFANSAESEARGCLHRLP